MKNTYKFAFVLLTAMAANAQDTATNSYTQTNLTSDIAGLGAFTDPKLINPWGLSRNTTSYWWAADEGTGFSTVYDGTGDPSKLIVSVPPFSGTGPGTPAGTCAVGTADFVFSTLDGTISEWASVGTKAVIKVKKSGAVYTGCTTATSGTKQTIFVANSAGGVEAYTTAFVPVTLAPGAFTDPSVPAGYTPYGIQALGAKIFVTFSAAPGEGGYVDEFNQAGTLLLSFAQGKFNQPWGIALAPAGFGKFPGDILVGNVGSGEIGAYSPTTGKFAGFLENSSGKPLANSGLWGLGFGGGNANSGATSSLYFTAGIDNYLHGLFGMITAN